jgi:hypothetical protein
VCIKAERTIDKCTKEGSTKVKHAGEKEGKVECKKKGRKRNIQTQRKEKQHASEKVGKACMNHEGFLE